jgi:hypothetical protein
MGLLPVSFNGAFQVFLDGTSMASLYQLRVVALMLRCFILARERERPKGEV